MIRSMRLVALLAAASAACAATLTGVVKDPSGAPVNGAVVEIRAVPPTGAALNARADSAGAFRVENLAPGRYQVRVARYGFETSDTPVTVEEGKDAAIEIKLKVAEVRQQIEVTGIGRGNADRFTVRCAIPESAIPSRSKTLCCIAIMAR